MSSPENSKVNQVDELKQEIARLRLELDELNAKYTRLQNNCEKSAEEKLRANEAALEAFFDNAPGILQLLDEKYCWINMDRTAPTYYGLTRETMKGKCIKDLSPGFFSVFGDVFKHVLQTGEPLLNFETNNLLPERPGEILYWRNSFFRVPLPGEKWGLGFIGLDVTEVKRSEKTLAYERELFEGIFDNIPVMITIYDPQLKNFRFNKELKQVLGWTEEDAADGDFMSKAYPDPEYRKLVSEFMLSLQPGWKEWNVTAKNGSTIACSWANILLTNGVQIGIGIDIRERKQYEDTLRENEQRLQAMFNNAAIGIVEVDSLDRFIAVNDRLCKILGYSREELLGKTVSELTAPEDRELSDDMNARLHRGEFDMFDYEKRYLKKDGTPFWVHVTVSSVQDSKGRHINSIGTVEDISDRKKSEEALLRSETILKQAGTMANLGAWEIELTQYKDINKNPLLWSEQVYRIFGYEPGSVNITNDLFFSHVHPEDKQKVSEAVAMALSEKTSYNVEHRIVRTDGTERTVVEHAEISFDDWGKPVRIIGAVQDITDRKKMMEEHKKNEDWLTMVINAADLGTWDFDIETGVAIHSLRHDQIFGYKELQPEWSYEISVQHIFPEYHQIVREAVARALQTGTLLYDAKIRWPDGSVHWIAPRGRVQYNNEGKPVRMAGIVSDITERKIAEEAVKESEEKFRLLFENITEGVALHEMIYENDEPVDYRIIDVNPSYTKYTGFDISSNKGTLATTFYKTEKVPYLKEYANVANTGLPYKFQTFFPDVNKHFIISVISPRKGQFATVLEDVTELKLIEHELKQKNEELTRFIYTVSHDLKSPLVTIKSFTSYLKEDIESHDKSAQEKDIAYVQNAADKMGKLLDELLELSRIGRKEEPKTEVSLKTIAESALDLVAGRIAGKKVKVQFTGPPVMLYGHTQRLIQLYQNLLDNAVKFMGSQPEPTIEIGAFVDGHKNEVVLFIRDNGSGIDPQYHHKIFGLFEKLDTSTEGTGIGLALIKRIVEVHGGTIWFTSEGKDKGTTFYFTLEKAYILH